MSQMRITFDVMTNGDDDLFEIANSMMNENAQLLANFISGILLGEKAKVRPQGMFAHVCNASQEEGPCTTCAELRRIALGKDAGHSFR